MIDSATMLAILDRVKPLMSESKWERFLTDFACLNLSERADRRALAAALATYCGGMTS